MRTQFVPAFSGDGDQERRLIQSLDGMNYAGVQDRHLALLKFQRTLIDIDANASTQHMDGCITICLMFFEYGSSLHERQDNPEVTLLDQRLRRSIRRLPEFA